MRIALLLLPLAYFATCLVTLDNSPRVTLDQGPLRGRTLKSLNGKTIFSFQGIPYAAPPLRELRFKAPQEAPKWREERNAQQESSACLQMHLILNTFVGNEDCLYLNVYTPKLQKEGAGLCVMVWIHGGGFMFGSGDTELYGPHFLLDHDIVLITFNYRIGALGFLNLNSTEASGNYGLKDQIAVLQWVQKNVAKFGGNPDCVTIFGESAGGASVHYLMVSPLAKGLFHRAIAQSGSAYNPWAMTYDATRQGHPQLAKRLGCLQKNVNDVIKCLRDVEARHFAKISFEMVYSTIRSKSVKRKLFAPTIEPVGMKDAFLTEDPRSLIERGEINDVPLMAGYMTHEGMLHLFGFTDMNAKTDYETNWARFLPCDMEVNPFPSKAKSTMEIIDTFYRNISKDFLDQYILLNSDLDFVLGVDDLVREVAALRLAPVYYFLFSYEGSFSLLRKYISTSRSGTSHADELGYLFSQSKFHPVSWRIIPDNDLLTIEKMTKLWTNFAKTGNPTPNSTTLGIQWKPVEAPLKEPDKAITRYLNIGNKLVMKEANLNEKRIKFWKKLRNQFCTTRDEKNRKKITPNNSSIILQQAN